MVSRLAPTTQLLQPAFDFGTVTAGASAQSTKGVRTALAARVTLAATAVSEAATATATARRAMANKGGGGGGSNLTGPPTAQGLQPFRTTSPHISGNSLGFYCTSRLRGRPWHSRLHFACYRKRLGLGCLGVAPQVGVVPHLQVALHQHCPVASVVSQG